jgi:hypothetical protein
VPAAKRAGGDDHAGRDEDDVLEHVLTLERRSSVRAAEQAPGQEHERREESRRARSPAATPPGASSDWRADAQRRGPTPQAVHLDAPEADTRALSFHIRTLRAEDFPPLLAAVAAPSGTAVIDHPPASPADVLKLFHPNSKIT